MDHYESLLEKLKKEPYPHVYTHKFAGDNTLEFLESVANFEKLFPMLQLEIKRMSHEGRYVAYTFSFTAESAEQIIHVIKMTALIQGLRIIL